MTATIELSSARKKLQNVLGEGQTLYFGHLKNWFRKRISKENFDIEARKLLAKENAHLHNEFLLAILNKCQTLANFTPSVSVVTSPPPMIGQPKFQQQPQLPSQPVQPTIKHEYPLHARPEIALGNERLKKGRVKTRHKSNKANLDHRFQPVFVMPRSATNEGPTELRNAEKNLRYCYREPLLPDISLIHGRMLLIAWEEGLNGTDDQTVNLIVRAVENLFRRLITALVKKRRGYQVRDHHVSYAIGSKRANPWLLNTQNHAYSPYHSVEEVSESIDDMGKIGTAGFVDSQVPTEKPVIEDAEQRSALEVACSLPDDESESQRRPINLFELMALLQEQRWLLPNHTVYSLNLERTIARLHHPGYDD